MRNLVFVIFTVLVLIFLVLPFTEGKNQKNSLDITSLTINFDKTGAIFTVNYDLSKLPRLYILFLGSRGLEPKVKAVFSNFDYEIIKMDQDKAVLRVENITRYDKGYYLHDSRIKFGEGISVIDIYTPDSPYPKRYSNPYLFNWDNVPGNESFRLNIFLKDDLGIDWAVNAQILKSDDNRTISVFTEERYIEIALDKNNGKALLRTSDSETYELQVKKDKDGLGIYSPYIYSTPNIYYRS
ncbi:hypothetical protein ANME2D_02590 [Candidatus Methanoperedens nitroreducens]|uniref:Uncharacterized protein n=1 Tax=Candidatus Methanoperedens nitratireducens TaxID=1392998 RepID=A0A062V433_9EURY|nr:hypothetical protein [Candidatus Methanoperedens nitroreducens]KCZ70569.1 hypothetical protein ANME2D_02590 [Candidatus Methanoperedens nitroreducens]MDJ1420422.1 hypothetical protein [Candidatus Methanoperedens sp.]